MRRHSGERQNGSECTTPTGMWQRRLTGNIGSDSERVMLGLRMKQIHHLSLDAKGAILSIHDPLKDRMITLNPDRPLNLA
jgi:hypothetical protein